MSKKENTKNKQKNKKFKLFLGGSGTILALTSLVTVGVGLDSQKNQENHISEQSYLSENVVLPTTTQQSVDSNGIDINDEQSSINNLLSIGATVTSENAEQLTKEPLDAKTITKYGIKKADTSSYSFKDGVTYKYTATNTGIKIYVTFEGKAATVAPVEIAISRNSFEGTFSSIEKEKEFLAVTTTVADNEFKDELLLSISLPDVQEIGKNAFWSSNMNSVYLPEVRKVGESAFRLSYGITSLDLPNLLSVGSLAFCAAKLTYLSIPKLVDISYRAFMSVVNEDTTIVVIHKILNTQSGKNLLFDGWENHYNTWKKITFVNTIPEVDADIEQDSVNNLLSIGATVTSENAEQLTKEPLDAKIITKYGIKNVDNSEYRFKLGVTYKYTATNTGIKIYVTSEGKAATVAPVEIAISRNSFEGTFSSIEKEKEFLAVTTTVADNEFKGEKLLSISLSNVEEIGEFAFYNSEMTSVSLPNVEEINQEAFGMSKITSLDLPNALIVGDHAFYESKLTFLSIPKLSSGSFSPFTGIVNLSSTHVVIPKDLDNKHAKDQLFGGDSNYQNISFSHTMFVADVNEEQSLVNNLLSIGAIRLPKKIEKLMKSPLDARAIAKYGIKNADTSAYSFKDGYTYEYIAIDKSIKIYVSKDSEISSIEPIEIPISKNSFTGSFTTLEKEKEFLAIKDIVHDFNGLQHMVFYYENKLTSISLPDTTYIGEDAFYRSPLTSINVPSASHVGKHAFFWIRNYHTTHVTMQSKHNNGYILNDIFNGHGWSNVEFTWVDGMAKEKAEAKLQAAVDVINSSPKLEGFNNLPDGVKVDGFAIFESQKNPGDLDVSVKLVFTDTLGNKYRREVTKTLVAKKEVEPVIKDINHLTLEDAISILENKSPNLPGVYREINDKNQLDLADLPKGIIIDRVSSIVSDDNDAKTLDVIFEFSVDDSHVTYSEILTKTFTFEKSVNEDIEDTLDDAFNAITVNPPELEGGYKEINDKNQLNLTNLPSGVTVTSVSSTSAENKDDLTTDVTIELSFDNDGEIHTKIFIINDVTFTTDPVIQEDEMLEDATSWSLDTPLTVARDENILEALTQRADDSDLELFATSRKGTKIKITSKQLKKWKDLGYTLTVADSEENYVNTNEIVNLDMTSHLSYIYDGTNTKVDGTNVVLKDEDGNIINRFVMENLKFTNHQNTSSDNKKSPLMIYIIASIISLGALAVIGVGYTAIRKIARRKHAL